MAKEADLVKIWRGRIRLAEEGRKDFQEITKRTELAYKGKLRPDNTVWDDPSSWISVEKTQSAIRAALPTLLYNRPRWSVQPTRPIMQPAVDPMTGQPAVDPMTGQPAMEDVSWQLARSKEIWLNYIWEKAAGNEHVRVAIVAAFLGYGTIKVGYIPLHEDSEKRGEFKYDEAGDFILGRDGLPELEKGDYLRNDQGEVKFDEDGMPVLDPGPTTHEEFFADYIHYDNLLHDPEGANVFENTHKWVVEEWLRPLDEVRGDSRFKADVRKAVKATRTIGSEPGPDPSVGMTTSDAMKPGSEQVVEDDKARVRGFDIYDFQAGRYYVLPDAASHHKGDTSPNDKFLLDMPIPSCMKRGPYKFLRFNEIPGEWYPKPDAEGMAKLELEYNITRSQGMLQRRNSRPRWLETEGFGFGGESGGAIERDKFLNGSSHTIALVKKADSVRAAEQPQIDATHYHALPLIAADFNEVSGQPGATRGVADADTATEASILSQTNDVRNNDRRDNCVQTFLGKIGKQLLEFGKQYATLTTWVPVARPGDPQPFEFEEVRPEFLRGDFDVTVEMGSTAPKNSAARVALMERILTAVSQNPMILASKTFIRRIFESLDIQDEELFNELQQIGQMVLQSQAPPPAAGAGTPGEQTLNGGATDPLGAIMNAMSGAGTGAPIN